MTYFEMVTRDKENFEKKLNEFKGDALMSMYYSNCLRWANETLETMTVEEAGLEVDNV